MLTNSRVSSKEQPNFKLFWELYQQAFPQRERREKEYQRQTLEKENYHLDVWFDDHIFVGFIAWWSLDDWRFVEHFATDSALRGKGYGKEILTNFIHQSSKPVILEVEHPDTQISIRRIGFYSRLGFKLNEDEYSHPPYNKEDKEFVSLKLMSYPESLSPESVISFKENSFPEVHFGWF